MEQQLDELYEKETALEEEQKRLRKEIEDVKEKLLEERMKTLAGKEDFYAKKLNRLKTYVEAFVAETAYDCRGVRIEPRSSNLQYAFRKMELPYKDDFHEVMEDPLDWTVAEYDLLGMQECLEIRIDYHSEALKGFVTRWMEENLPYAAPYPLEGLYAFRR